MVVIWYLSGPRAAAELWLLYAFRGVGDTTWFSCLGFLALGLLHKCSGRVLVCLLAWGVGKASVWLLA